MAWQLATGANVEMRDGKEALKLLGSKPNLYFDEVRILETHAAAYAETGDFSKAVKYQKKAIKKAKNLDRGIPVMYIRLESYRAEKPWRGYYHAKN